MKALLAVATLVAGLLTPITATAATSPDGHDVTLITGDRVTLTKAPNGKQVVRIQPGPGRADQVFFKQAKGDRLTVIPGDVARQVRDGRLDRALFDVTGLIEQGYDDKSRQDIPVIASGGLQAQATRDLASIGAFAAKLPKGRFWADGAARIRLDRKLKATLDQSVPQIGAPAAWQAGYTGKGVKVAVVDTGYDREHPDLKNVVAEKDFTGDGMEDGNGHGTHVASTLAGSGAASNGKYRGVAPDASLIIAKALDDDGGGSLSDVIDAVEWAADSGAQIVSMSLGSSTPSDGTDDLSVAVDRISREKGVLFVVAAGNDGEDVSISTPGAATSALTVGSVSKQDVLSEFSSRGPRAVDFAVKPDATGPGENIVAAKAGGGYVGASGTSMATPHVSGAAALLAQQHPQWTGEQLKVALTSSAKPGGSSVYAQGTGRVDVARAVTQSAVASTNVSFGLVRWPHSSGQPQTKDVVYSNHGTAPVELSLDFTSDAPAGVFTVSADKVVVPAGGTAAVQVRSNPAALKVGRFGGRLTASGGGAVVQTVVGITGEAESYDVTLHLVDRTGEPASDDLEHSVQFYGAESVSAYVEGGKSTVRLPKGAYRLASMISSPGSVTLAGNPNLVVSKDLDLTLDARKGKRFQIRSERRSSVDLYRSFGAVIGNGEGSTAAVGATTENRAIELYSVPAAGAAPDTFETTYDAQATDSLDADLVARGPFYSFVHHWPGRIPGGVNMTVRDRDMAKVRTTFGSKNGKSGLVARVLTGFSPMQVFGGGAATRVRQPGERVEFFSAGRELFWINALYREPGEIGGNPPSPVGIVWATVFGFQAGSTTEPWNQAVEGPGLPGPANGKPGADENLWVGHRGATVDGRLPLFADSGPYQHTRFDPAVKGGWTVYRDGVQVGRSDTYFSFSGKAVTGPAEYKIVGYADRNVPWSELSTHVEGTWTFRAAFSAQNKRVPVFAVKFAPALDGYNRAPASPRTLVPLKVQRQGTADLPLTELAVKASFDDGKTWVDAPVVRTSRSGYAVVTNPPGATFVSLQVKAKDSGGNSVETKVIRAYRLGSVR